MTRSSSAATQTGPTSASIARRQTWTMMGAPWMSASGLPGRRVEFMRAGIRTIGLDIISGEQKAEWAGLYELPRQAQSG